MFSCSFCISQAHVVSAFEQSLSNMTQRLQHLTSTAERKVNETKNSYFTIQGTYIVSVLYGSWLSFGMWHHGGPWWWSSKHLWNVSFWQTTWHNIPKDSHLHICCNENLKSHLYGNYLSRWSCPSLCSMLRRSINWVLQKTFAPVATELLHIWRHCSPFRYSTDHKLNTWPVCNHILKLSSIVVSW